MQSGMYNTRKKTHVPEHKTDIDPHSTRDAGCEHSNCKMNIRIGV